MGGVRRQMPTLAEARALGAALSEVRPEMLRQVPGRTRRWFTGGEPYLSVIAEHDADGLVFVEVSFRGRFTRRARGATLETGVSDELDRSSVMPMSKVESLTRDAPDVVAVGVAILEGKGLDAEARWLQHDATA